VLCSSAVRARQTLEAIMPVLGGAEVAIEDRLYGASSGQLLERLREVPDNTASVLLIGHQPAIQELALALAGGGAELASVRAKFPTAALATLVFAGGWSGLARGRAELAGFVKPKELAAGPG
jgi:phosphohistidine phosphatase